MQPTRGEIASQGSGEAALVARARTGDQAAIRTLVQQHNQRLYRVARAVLGDDLEAEDAVQEVYLRAFTRLDGFRGESAFATWLTRIALNEARQRRRKRRFTIMAPDSTERAEAQSDVIAFPGPRVASDPESAAARHQLRDVIQEAVSRLPHPLRLVFVLRDIEEMSTAETASCLGVGEATVKTRLHRARRQLRSILDAEVATALAGAFPFAGARCERMVDRVVERLEGPDAGASAGSRSCDRTGSRLPWVRSFLRRAPFWRRRGC